ncbi:MAG: hypothetical protein G01um101429_170 [Parcubacteria group bacterium Gr01-1014_29]|nr:MAG: hypothetical protein G01um101429_170 [Parcubacteria group bacterium Gr01-1014_29]
MFTIALILYFLFIIGYTAFSAALVYHIRAYAVREDPMHSFVTPFIASSLILIIISAYLFSRVPWDSLM